VDWVTGQSSCDAVGYRGGPDGLACMPCGRRFLSLPHSHSPVVLILLLSLLALVPMAGACPPDPIWIEGMYDGADHDDAVEMASSLAGVVELCLIVERSLSMLPGRLSAEASDVVTGCFAARRGRSPPYPLSVVL
jgi:hypothetical protein